VDVEWKKIIKLDIQKQNLKNIKGELWNNTKKSRNKIYQWEELKTIKQKRDDYDNTYQHMKSKGHMFSFVF